MRVAWVHPSWRDLVIHQLAGDPELRRRFLARCGVDGAALALSGGGGIAGERERPLLVDDADWDALGDGLYHLCDELDGVGAVRLLAVLEGHDAEARALSSLVVHRLERRWHGSPIELDALEAWTAAAARLPGGATLTATWLELEPAAVPQTPVELERFCDWLRLVELLADHDDFLLDRLGFPDRFDGILDAFAGTRADGEPPVEADLRADALMRLRRLEPDRAVELPRFDMSLEDGFPPFEPMGFDALPPDFSIDRALRDLLDEPRE